VVPLLSVSTSAKEFGERTAEQRMWGYYVGARARGCHPNGAELDLAAGYAQLRSTDHSEVAR
jgi:hypothetical protein